MKMPDYTLEQKAAAFDTLWRECGKGEALFEEWKSVRPVQLLDDGSLRTDGVIKRVPVYKFSIMYVGHCERFSDVLHRLATEKETPDS